MDQTPAAGTALNETAVRRDHDELTLFVIMQYVEACTPPPAKTAKQNPISKLIFKHTSEFLLKSNKFAVICHPLYKGREGISSVSRDCF